MDYSSAPGFVSRAARHAFEEPPGFLLGDEGA